MSQPIAAITTFLSKYVKPQAHANAIPRDDDAEADEDAESEEEDLLDDLEDMNVEGQDGARRTKAKYMRMFVSRQVVGPLVRLVLIFLFET